MKYRHVVTQRAMSAEERRADRSFGEAWAEDTLTGRAVKGAAKALGIDTDSQRVQRGGKGDRLNVKK